MQLPGENHEPASVYELTDDRIEAGVYKQCQELPAPFSSWRHTRTLPRRETQGRLNCPIDNSSAMSLITVRKLLILAALLAAFTVECKPFFDAVYDALNGNSRRSYGYYNGYRGGYDTEGYEGHRRERGRDRQRTGKSWSDICRVHYPNSEAFPGAGGIVCPYWGSDRVFYAMERLLRRRNIMRMGRR